MRTLEDVADAFRALADTAPEPTPLPVAPASAIVPSRRSRLAPMAAAAAVAATVLVAGGIVYAATRPDDHSTPAGTGSRTVPALPGPAANEAPDLTFRFTATAPAGSTMTSYGIDRAGQVLDFLSPASLAACRAAKVRMPGCGPVAEVRLHYATSVRDRDERRFDIAGVTHRVATRINGRPAFYGRIDNALDPHERLYWEYAPGGVAEAQAGSRSAERALAESVRSASITLRSPVAQTMSRLQYLNVLTAEPADSAGRFEQTDAVVRKGGFNLGWGRLVYGANVPPANPQHVTVNGRTWTITGGDQLLATLDGSPVPLTVLPYLNTTRDALIDMLRSVRLAPDLADQKTWFVAADAFH